MVTNKINLPHPIPFELWTNKTYLKYTKGVAMSR